MKTLFLTCNGIEDAAFGGAKASIRNYELLKKYGEVDVLTVQKKSNLASLLSLVQGYFPPISKKDLKEVKEKLASKQYDLVFFDGSHFGKLVKYVAGKDIKTICFFHNCEYDYIEVRFGQGNSLKKTLYKRTIQKQEALSAHYASCNLVFTKRDAKRVAELYGVEEPQILPLSLLDVYEQRKVQNQEKECLLFGPLVQANEEAFEWFVKKVSPYLNCKTKVAGKGFETYHEQWSNEKVVVQGYVEDIAKLYAEASCVAIPLWSGGGMKIKTAEAMMFGKYIFGTKEAFVGYEFDSEEIGGQCDSAEEFIQKINKFLDREDSAYFNAYARKRFEENYSLTASEAQFGAILKSCKIKCTG